MPVLLTHSTPNNRHLDRSEGTNNVRWFEFQGNDRLILTPTEDGKGGTLDRKNATCKLIWERIKN